MTKKQLTATLVILFGLALVQGSAWAFDLDGDGHWAIGTSYTDPVSGTEIDGDDCDDSDENRFPDNSEVCDVSGHDEDCDPSTFGYADQDHDGIIADYCENFDNLGNRYGGTDCDDGQPTVYPGAPDFCDGLDNNCDNVVDDHAPTQYVDYDLDGHGDPSTATPRVCAGTAGFTPLPNDCDDTNPAIQPGDIVCATGSADGYNYCGSDGQWQTGLACAEGSVCVAQDNGTGVCVPDKLKDKKDKT
jgi:hypothetical protein